MVEQPAEHLSLHGQDIGRVPFVEPVPQELLEERLGRRGGAKVERDGLERHGGACHWGVFIVVKEGAAWRHQCERRNKTKATD